MSKSETDSVKQQNINLFCLETVIVSEKSIIHNNYRKWQKKKLRDITGVQRIS